MKKDDPVRHFRTTGLLFTAFFVVAIGVDMSSLLFDLHYTVPGALVHPVVLSLYLVSAIFLVSALVPAMYWIQPAVLLMVVPIPQLDNPAPMYSLGAFVIGVIMLFQLGYMDRRRRIKIVALILYLFASIILGVMRGERLHPVRSVAPVLFTLVFLVLLYILFKEKIVVYLREPKPPYSLAEAGLSRAEAAYVRQVIAGKSLKEISAESERQESTVRNTLSRAYKKLEVTDRASLLDKLKQYEIKE